ncbi:MAG: EFR1 family ferrodoxin [Bacteroidetes bacterium]|nr:EFR1 family ferrodoxin [Bacteroidota bacterium]
MPEKVGQLILYYFSGTGNARNVAAWFAEEAQSRQIPTEVVDIAGIDRKHINPFPGGALIGFVSPTHGFNYPPVSMYFIFRFPRSRGNRVFLMNTRAGLKLSKWFVPGLSGLALWLSAIVLLLKGYRIFGLRSIDLPSNWISFHPGVKEAVVESIYAHCKRVTKGFASKILDGKKVYTAFRDIIQDILVSPISIGYFFMGRFMLAKTFYANELCDNCELCSNNCPMHAILTVDKRPFWSYRCESCMRCMNNCPKRAIETSHGYITGIMFLINLVILALFWKWVATFITIPEHNAWIEILLTFIRWGITFLSLVVFYRIFHYLLRIPLLRDLFYYTSLTRYRFWRRYKPSKKMISQLP